MNILRLLLNSGKIFGALKKIEGVIESCIKEKRVPTIDDDKSIIDAAEELLSIGIINIPGLTTEQITQALEDLKKRL